jgi:hypothetical protein
VADSIDQDFATTAITLEEHFRGWLEINRTTDRSRSLPSELAVSTMQKPG